MRGTARDPGIDALRAVAALSVVAIHGGLFPHGRPDSTPDTWVDELLFLGWLHLDVGVDIFFALSGFLVAGPFLRSLLSGRPLPDLRRYAARRALRVLPAYWLALAAITAFPYVPWPWWQWAMHGTLVQNPFPGQLSRGLGVAWTLHCEVVFYLLVPVVFALVRRRVGARPVPPGRVVGWLLAVGAASTVFAVLAAGVGDEGQSQWSRPLRLSVPATLCLFVPGMLLAVLRTPEAAARWPRLPDVLRRLAGPQAVAITVTGLTVLAVAMDAVPSLAVQDARRPLRAVMGALVLAWLTSGRRHGRIVRSLAPIGVVSYGLYLWHFVVQRDLELYGWFLGGRGSLGFVVNFVVLVVASLPLAVLSWWLIERPGLRIGDRIRSRRRGASASLRGVTSDPHRDAAALAEHVAGGRAVHSVGAGAQDALRVEVGAGDEPTHAVPGLRLRRDVGGPERHPDLRQVLVEDPIDPR